MLVSPAPRRPSRQEAPAARPASYSPPTSRKTTTPRTSRTWVSTHSHITRKPSSSPRCTNRALSDPPTVPPTKASSLARTPVRATPSAAAPRNRPRPVRASRRRLARLSRGEPARTTPENLVLYVPRSPTRGTTARVRIPSEGLLTRSLKSSETGKLRAPRRSSLP